jgi:hypothetical protein
VTGAGRRGWKAEVHPLARKRKRRRENRFMAGDFITNSVFYKPLKSPIEGA